MQTMNDDYSLPSLLVKRVPHSIHDEGAAMMCYESYCTRNHDESPPWASCEAVHDRRSSEDYMSIKKYVDSKNVLVALSMQPEMLAYVDNTMPFMSFSSEMYVMGYHLANTMLEQIVQADTMEEVRWTAYLDFDVENWGPPMLREAVRDGDQWYRLKGLIENCDPQTMKLATMKRDMPDRDNFRYPLAQRIALARFDMKNDGYKIIGYSDGAIMLEFAGMVVGIEPDGYTHS